MESPCFIESLLYDTQPDGSAQCGVCERRCRISEGRRGFCGSRMNFDGRLYNLTYGDLTSVTLNSIEKKPMFHYWPGSKALSAGSLGCNLRCVYCQNYSLSMVDANLKNSQYAGPEDFIVLASQKKAEGLSFTFNEASCTLLEYIIDCFNLAVPRGLYRNLNTNGYMTPETLNLLIKADLDSLCIDIKGDGVFYRRLCNGADPEPVWRNAVEAKKRGLHVEMVNLVIPGANDGDECIGEVISRAKDELGRDSPLHFTRFYPTYRARDYGLNHITPVETLEELRNAALDEGMEYVYVGNVPGHNGENTFCPNCRRLLIKRFNFTIHEYHITNDGCCPECGMKIKIAGKPRV